MIIWDDDGNPLTDNAGNALTAQATPPVKPDKPDSTNSEVATGAELWKFGIKAIPDMDEPPRPHLDDPEEL